MGTSATVSRALRLIGESGLEDGGVEALAGRLGVGARHLRRLFLKHLGATPNAVAQTRRLHFAKKLIDETSLPMSHVALASGFGSVRRFNANISQVYKRTPTHIRRIAHQKTTLPENHFSFRLRFRPPYHWQGMLAFLAARATPGVEAVEQGSYRRTISVDGSRGYFDVSLDEPNHTLVAQVLFPNPRSLFVIVERIRAMFDLNADWSKIVSCLRTEPTFTQIVKDEPGLRVPGAWDGFELAIRAILGQQTTVKGATLLAGRIATTLGQPFAGPSGLTHLFPPPEVLADARLASVGMPGKRAEAIRNLARAVADKHICFEGIVDSGEFLARLCEIPGIGRWTAQYIAMRALGEPDAFPTGDLGLLRALGITNARELEARSEAWRPWRAYATMYLWKLGHASGAAAAKKVSKKSKVHAAAGTAYQGRHPERSRSSGEGRDLSLNSRSA